MEHVDNAYKALVHYFGVLEQVGQYDRNDTKGLLIYCFLVDQIFTGPLYQYLDNEGLAAFNKAIRCISSSGCLVKNLSAGMHISQPRGFYLPHQFRITEQDIPRFTENGNLRSIEDISPI